MELSVDNISYRYRKKSNWVLQNVSFKVGQTERVGIIAPSGYGKSTLAKIMAGMTRPTSGEILLDGQQLTPNQRLPLYPVQLIYQHPEQAVNPRWKMSHILEETSQNKEEVLKGLGIKSEWLNRFPRELSGGELQRFCVARSLAFGTKFLVADEVSTMLDTVTQAQLWEYILAETKQREIGLVVISHNRELLNRICTRIIDLRQINESGGDMDG